jgi:hypothetical protein
MLHQMKNKNVKKQLYKVLEARTSFSTAETYDKIKSVSDFS